MLHVGHTANTVSVLASWLVTLGKAWLCLTSQMRPVPACHGVLIRTECFHTCSAIHMMSAVIQHNIQYVRLVFQQEVWVYLWSTSTLVKAVGSLMNICLQNISVQKGVWAPFQNFV